MAHAIYTGDASPAIAAVNQLMAKFKELEKLNTEIKLRASLDVHSFAGVESKLQAQIQALSNSNHVQIQARVTGMPEQAKKMREYFSKGVPVKILPYVTNGSLKQVQGRIDKILAAAPVDVALKLQPGASTSLRSNVRQMLDIISRNSYIDVQIRAGAIQKALDGVKNKKVILDIDVQEGTAAKIKSLLSLLKSLREGAKIPVKLDIDPGLATLIKGLSKDLKTAADQASRLNQRVGSAIGGTQKLRKGSASAAASELGNRIGAGADIAGAAALGGLGASLKVLEDFDRSLRNVNSIAQLSEPSLQKLGEAVRSIAADPNVRKGPRDLAAGLYDIYSVGYKDAQALDILRKAAQGAGAGVTSTAVSVGVLTGALKAGIKGAATPREVMDSLFQTVNDGRVSFEQLAGAAGQIFPTLAAAGVSLQDYGAFLTVATGKSQSASEATNDLQNLIQKIVNPSKEAGKYFHALGIETSYADLKSKGLAGKLEEIRNKTHGSADAIKRLLPDIQAQRAAMTVLTDGMAAFNVAVASQARASEGMGSTARAAAKQNRGWANDLDQARKNLEEFAIVAGTTVVPAFTQLLQEGNGLLKSFKSLSPEMQSGAVKFALYGGSALLLIGRIKSLIEVVLLARKAFQAFQAEQAVSAGIGSTGAGAGLLSGAAAFASLAATAAVATTAIGLWGINNEKAGEKATRLKVATDELEKSTTSLEAAFQSLSQVASIDPAAVGIAERLGTQYEKVKNSLAGLQKFQSTDVLQAQRDIFYNPRLKPLERQVLLDEVHHIQAEIDGQIRALQFKAIVKAEADRGSLANLEEAFHQSYGSVIDWISSQWNGWIDDAGEGIRWLGDQWKSWIDDAAIGASSLVKAFGFDGIIDDARRGFDFLIDHIKSAWVSVKNWISDQATTAWRRFNGQTANYGETEGPSLPGNYSPAELAAQKRRNAAYRAAQAKSSSFPIYGPPILSRLPSSPTVALNTPERRRAALMAAQQAAREASSYAARPAPYFNTSSGRTSHARSGRSEAERAADQQRREALSQEREQLNQNAAAYTERAKKIENAARLEIESIKQIRDSARSGVWNGLQEDLIKMGIIDNPLGPLLHGFENLMGFLDQAKGKGNQAAASMQNLFDAVALNKKGAKQLGHGGKAKPRGYGSLEPADPSHYALVGEKFSGDAKALVDDVQRQFGRLSGAFYAVPKAWGKAVTSADGYTARFAMQTQLASAEGQKMLEAWAKDIDRPDFPKKLAAINRALNTTFAIHGKGKDAAADLARQLTNQADYLAGQATQPLTIKAAQEATKKLNAETRQSIQLLAQQANFLEGNRDPKAFEKFKAMQVEEQRLRTSPDTSVFQLLQLAKKDKSKKPLADKALATALSNFSGLYDAQQMVGGLSDRNAASSADDVKQEADQKSRQEAINQAIKSAQDEQAARRRLQEGESTWIKDESLTQNQRDVLLEGERAYWQRYEQLTGLGLDQTRARMYGLLAAKDAMQNTIDEKGSQSLTDARASADQEQKDLKAQITEQQTQKILALKGAMSELERQEDEWRRSDADRAQNGLNYTAEQLKQIQDLRDQVRALLTDTERMNSNKFLNDQRQISSNAGIYDPRVLRRNRLRYEAKDAGVSDAQISAQMPELEKLDQLREYRDRVGEVVAGVRDDITDMFANIQEKGLSSIGDLFDSISKRINQLGAQILADKVWSYIAGALGGLLGGGTSLPATPAYSMGSGTGVNLHSPPSFAIGLRHVPYDGFIARLHEGESILTRTQTERMSTLALAGGPNSISARREAEMASAIAVRQGEKTSGDSGSGRRGDVIHIANVNMPPGTDSKNFVPRMKTEAEPKISRRSQQNLAYDRVSPGGKQR